ncbi:hypothetical protein Ancab_032315 [Ancistrocladus abbreviatus]
MDGGGAIAFGDLIWCFPSFVLAGPCCSGDLCNLFLGFLGLFFHQIGAVHFEMSCWSDGFCGVCLVRGPLLAGWVLCVGFLLILGSVVCCLLVFAWALVTCADLFFGLLLLVFVHGCSVLVAGFV